LVVLVLALVVAVQRLIYIAPMTLGFARVAPVTAAGIVAATAAVGIMCFGALLAGRRGRWRAATAIAFMLLTLTRLVAIGLFPSPITSDWRAYVELANGILDGQGFWSARATGYPAVLAGAFALLGRQPLSGELLNLGVAILTGGMLFVLMEPRFGRRAALAGLLIFAIVPSQVLFSVILGTETLYSGLMVLAVLLVVRVVDRGLIWAVFLGLLLGLAQYVRPTSQYLLPAALAALFLAGIGARKALSMAVVAVVGFALVTAPIAHWNWTVNHRVSLAPYLYDGWILYVGLNVERHGTFNLADVQRVNAAVAADAAKPPVSDVAPLESRGRFDPSSIAFQGRWNDAAGRLAIERLRTNGISTLTMQPAKFIELWARADQASTWIFKDDRTTSRRGERLLGALSQAIWVLLIAGACFAFVTRLIAVLKPRQNQLPPTTQITVIALFLLITSAIHTLAQVSDRFHEYLVPALCALAGVGWLDVARWIGSQAAIAGPRRDSTGPNGSRTSPVGPSIAMRSDPTWPLGSAGRLRRGVRGFSRD
jgi:hypothetical protein